MSSNYPHSLVVICPAAARDSLLALGAALGVDGGMTVELSADGTAPATHYGSHSWAGIAFVAMMTRAVYPDPLPEGVTQQMIDAVFDLCTVSVDPVVDDVVLTGKGHFDHVIAGLGLQLVASEPV